MRSLQSLDCYCWSDVPWSRVNRQPWGTSHTFVLKTGRAMLEALFLLYFLVLLGTLVFKSRIVAGPWLFLLRAFFPNWKFFHATGNVPHLYARWALPNATPADALQWSPWIPIFPRRPRRLLHVFHNADTNLALVQQNLVEHLAADLNHMPSDADARALVSYQLVSRLVCQSLQAQQADCTHGQFEVRMVLDGTTGLLHEDTMMRSPVLLCR